MLHTYTYKPGDPVIFRVTKHSRRPGPRATNIFPTLHGETYQYQVEKYWTIIDTDDDGKLIVCTRRGKMHTLSADDPNLRPATWWERFWHGERFPKTSFERG